MDNPETVNLKEFFEVKIKGLEDKIKAYDIQMNYRFSALDKSIESSLGLPEWRI